MELARLGAANLLADIEINPPFSFPTFEDPTPPDPEAAAEAVRRVWRIPDGPIDDLTAHVEAAGAVILRVDFSTEAIIAAYSHMSGDHRWCFLNTRATDGARARFSLAHELGHAVLHWDRFEQPSGRIAEREAHRFAAALLMPRREVEETFGALKMGFADLVVLRQQWGVSIQAILMRAHDLGLISDSQRARMFQRLSARGWRRSEPGNVQLEAPTLFLDALQLHKTEHEYDDQTLADIAGLSPEKLSDLMPDYFVPQAPVRASLRVVTEDG